MMTMKDKFYNNSKKGLTLIEVLITLMILSIIFNLTFYSLNSIRKTSECIKFDYYCDSIVNFMNMCKNYCKSNDTSGSIKFNKDKNEIQFCCNRKNIGRDLVRYIKLPQNIIVRSQKKELNINRYGYMSTACTIVIKNLSNTNRKEITISVGTGYIQIKEESE